MIITSIHGVCRKCDMSKLASILSIRFHIAVSMFWLICHLITGSSYRAELALRYRSDVCATGATGKLNVTATNFDTGVFDCFHGDGVPRRLCYSCCCAPVLFAADAASIGLMGFWLALVLTSIFLPLIWIFGLVGRVYMRNTFKMERHLCMDILVWVFCLWCALIQENKFMDRVFEAKKQGIQGVILPMPTVARPVASA